MELKFYHCRHCGNIAVKPFDSGVPLVCCGEQMEELVANTTDAALEKHVPDVKVDGSNVHVQVGSTLHPMTPEHYITFVCLQTRNGYQFVQLTPEDAPVADFAVAEGDEPVKVQPSSRDPVSQAASSARPAPRGAGARTFPFVKLRFRFGRRPDARRGSRYHAT